SADAQPLPHHCTPPRHDALPISPIKIDMTSRQKGSKDIKPDESRVRQFLEGFNIETFEMVGTLGGEGSVYGLVKGAGGVHRVKVGDYLGRNHGQITLIDESKIDVVEIVPDGEGGWLEWPRSLTLKEDRKSVV